MDGSSIPRYRPDCHNSPAGELTAAFRFAPIFLPICLTRGGDGSFIIGIHGKLGDKGNMGCLSIVTTVAVTPKKKN